MQRSARLDDSKPVPDESLEISEVVTAGQAAPVGDAPAMADKGGQSVPEGKDTDDEPEELDNQLGTMRYVHAFSRRHGARMKIPHMSGLVNVRKAYRE